MIWRNFAMAVLVGLILNSNSFGADAEKGPLKLKLRSRVPEKRSGQPDVDKIVWETTTIEPSRAALIICDMWDDHWCKGAARRVSELAVQMNRVVHAARERGVFVIHAPSSVVDFYDDAPGRRLAKTAPLVKPPVPISTAKRWGTGWCWPDPKRESALPIDDSNMGCNCEVKCTLPEGDTAPWTRQIRTIDIEDGDAISHDAQEIYNLLSEREIDDVLIMGVHLNMCVLGRPFGIRQMTKLGRNVVLVRDMTDTMYDHRSKPYVDHFTGTDLVIEHVERYWCPTITSDQITGGKPFRFEEDNRPDRSLESR